MLFPLLQIAQSGKLVGNYHLVMVDRDVMRTESPLAKKDQKIVTKSKLLKPFNLDNLNEFIN